ncbi:hypothetical protein LMG27952_04894 [Paraburkholderia hiiakae]|uniref:Uncharacterized protein n=1 Tax=Paraburkholderia hiiakae TaxID=1081782 RepID=A0ABN7I5N2_9BURK|nr:hypothetical protein [Paraburkholderia hiiakae]CAD6549731.1 hypothetical protein LMG27952_04894 [Paraburkholderia hiiakae]
MKLSIMDEQEVRSFAAANESTILRLVIKEDAEQAHSEEHFFGDPFTVSMFMDFVKSLAEIFGGVAAASKVITSAADLFKWARDRLSNESSESHSEATVAERALVLLFEAYVNRRAGIDEGRIAMLLALPRDSVVKALGDLSNRGVARKARDGLWKYVRAS